MKIFILILFIVLYSASAKASCHAIYENPNLYTEWLKIDITKKTIRELKEMTKNLPLDEKLSLYDKIWGTLTKRMEGANKNISKRVEEIAKEKGQDAADTFKISAMTAMAKEYIPLNNLMIEDYARELSIKGIRNKILLKKVEDSVPLTRYKYLSLIPDANSTSKSAKKIARYKKIFDIEKFSMDLFENSQMGSRGFYTSSEKRVDLGTHAIKSILIDDMPTFVVKHEVKHAGFDRNRSLDGPTSIYDTQYSVLNDTGKLTDHSNYPQFMSAEELYNWSNDAYWVSERFKNIKNYTIKDIIADINHSADEVSGTIEIAEQTQELTEDFIAVVKKLKKDIDGGVHVMIPLTSELEIASTSDEIRFLSIIDKKTKRSMLTSISKEFRQDLLKFTKFKNTIDSSIEHVLIESGIEDIDNVSARDLRNMTRISRHHLRDQNLDATSEYKRILDYVINQQTRLKLNAIAIKAKSEEVTQFLKKFAEEFESARNLTGSEFLFTPEWNAKFLNLRKKFKELGMVGNENWRGSPAYRSQQP